MPANQTYLSKNQASRARLAALVNRLSDQELMVPLEAGWTVSAVLAHLAFWDRRAEVLLDKWGREGITPSPLDTDIVNEVVRMYCLALPPRAAPELAVSAALAIDQAIEQLTPEMIRQVETIGTTVRLDRGHHRDEHFDQIEQALRDRK